MKKTTLATIVFAAAMLTPVMVNAAPATPTPAPVAITTATTAQTKMVKVNGVEMTQAQARLVILQNVKNHTQMTPEEMTAYVNNLEANAANKR